MDTKSLRYPQDTVREDRAVGEDKVEENKLLMMVD